MAELVGMQPDDANVGESNRISGAKEMGAQAVDEIEERLVWLVNQVFRKKPKKGRFSLWKSVPKTR
jgi:hypothetical protein